MLLSHKPSVKSLKITISLINTTNNCVEEKIHPLRIHILIGDDHTINYKN